MSRARIIPVLLLRGNGLVKTRRFRDPVYVGDPVNAVRIFSEKEADELVVLDIDATREGREPNYELVAEIAGECFMPVAYGGGIGSLAQIRRLIRCGIEKVVINSAAVVSVEIVREASAVFGSQAVVGGIDVRRTLLAGHRVCAVSGTRETRLKPEDHARALVDAGAGEIFLNDIDNDGQMQGYDLALLKKVSGRVDVPVVACGGAGTLEHMKSALSEGGASAVAAGSMFVFQGRRRAVLINYPGDPEGVLA